MTFTARNVTGTNVYARNLYRSVAEVGGWDLNQIDRATLDPTRQHRNFSAHAQNVWWLMRGAGQEAVRRQPDLYHAAAYLGPRHLPCPMVLNVFDTSYLAYPRDFDWKWRLYARTVIPAAVKNSAAILTLSEHARTEILKAYPVAPERVHVVPPGIGAEFHPVTDPSKLAALRATYGVGDNYLLSGGGAHPRKNARAVIGAFARARQTLPDLTLTLFGPGIPESNEIQNALREYGVANATRLLGFVPLEDLPALYAGARVFVYASKLEGFGMPPVEAMACGLPVVAAPNPPMPEVLGDAACLTENDTPGALARGVLSVLDNAILAEILRQRGLERARRYTWEGSARRTVAIYSDVLEQSSSRDGRT
jgi:glycosyltransferase involved in cell wall biosynthesis